MSHFEHVHPDFRHIMLLTDQERIDFLDQPRWVGYQQARTILDTLHGLLRKPTKPRMPNLLIVGEPNNGKTTIIRNFYNDAGKGFVEEDGDVRAVKPVILAEAPPSADEKGLYISILEKFYAPYRHSDPASKLRFQVLHLMRSCRVRMLIIDEFHSLLTGPSHKQREVMNTIKLMCNELAIPIIGVGTREAVRVLHTDDQHASRFDVMALPLWEMDKNFQRLLMSFETILPLKKPSKLHAPELASLIHTISNGRIGDLHRLLVECATQAIQSGQEQIDKQLVEKNKWLRPTRGIRELMV